MHVEWRPPGSIVAFSHSSWPDSRKGAPSRLRDNSRPWISLPTIFDSCSFVIGYAVAGTPLTTEKGGASRWLLVIINKIYFAPFPSISFGNILTVKSLAERASFAANGQIEFGKCICSSDYDGWSWGAAPSFRISGLFEKNYESAEEVAAATSSQNGHKGWSKRRSPESLWRRRKITTFSLW